MLSVILTGFQQTGITDEGRHIPATRIRIEKTHGLCLFLRRHSGEGRNPVVYTIHSRLCLRAQAGMTLTQAGPLADLPEDVIDLLSVAVKYLAGLWRECLLADGAETDQARLAE